ncbi:hypothetical protein OBBRIDRAFT_833952 [Obba rivulosa]|uniref:Uncharacterized protein n=1 Tax=Obba rivulosa TaxID=1052685 RepID=A0A8E2AVH6_9APHY|nr:hypothetical protein OBBRIDRAFT_833952 [Obba rivulosa]
MMFSKTARNVVQLSPLLLEPQQPSRVLGSAKKAAQVLGIASDPDVVLPAHPTSMPTPSSRKRKSVFASLRTPAAFFQLAVTKTPFQDQPAPSSVIEVSTPTSTTHAGARKLRRKHVPTALTISHLHQSDMSPLSPFRYGLVRSPLTPLSGPAYSPLPTAPTLSPLRAVSSAVGSQLPSNGLHNLEELEKLTRCLGTNIPQEMFSSLSDHVQGITCFLDLYRMGVRADDSASRKPASARLERMPRIVRDMEGECRGRRISRDSATQKRRSRSVGDFYVSTFVSELSDEPLTPGIRSMRRLSRQLGSALRLAQSPVSPSVRPLRSSALFASSVIAARDETNVSPGVPGAESSVRRTPSLSRAKQTILGTDAQLMETFRVRFGTRALDFSLPPFPAPSGPLPSPPASALAKAKSPKVPYWVKSSFRPRRSKEASEFLSADSEALKETRSQFSAKPVMPATPRTRRIERRQGWGGEWHRGGLAEMAAQLKDL